MLIPIGISADHTSPNRIKLQLAPPGRRDQRLHGMFPIAWFRTTELKQLAQKASHHSTKSIR
jgi:hypothetical protein